MSAQEAIDMALVLKELAEINLEIGLDLRAAMRHLRRAEGILNAWAPDPDDLPKKTN